MKTLVRNKYARIALWSLLALTILLQGYAQISSFDEQDTNWLSITEGNIQTEFTANDDYSDLKRFGEAVGNKRIVMLDEATHGEGNVFALKARLVKYLHEEKGFDVFLFESGIYDVSRIWLNNEKSIREQAHGNLFYMYANSRRMQPLFNYIDAKRTSDRPLYFTGFDNRHSGGLSNTGLVTELKEYLIKAGSSIPLNETWVSFENSAQSLITPGTDSPSTAEQRQFFKVATEITDLAEKMHSDRAQDTFNSAGFWHRITKSIIRMAEVSWNERSIADHDLEMAKNIEWVMKEVYPGKKAIIWGQYVHLSPNGNRDHTDGPPEANVGTELKRIWPNDIYSVHFGGSKGSYTNFINLEEVKLSTPPTSSFEAILNEKQVTSAFIDASNLDLTAPAARETTMWTNHYDDAERIFMKDWNKHWDGMFLLNPIQPVDYIQR